MSDCSTYCFDTVFTETEVKGGKENTKMRHPLLVSGGDSYVHLDPWRAEVCSVYFG
jgi:hypothetical protein